MLDANMKQQLQTYLKMVSKPLELVASLDDSDKSRELNSLLEDIAAMSDHITLRTDGDDARRPSFAINKPDGTQSLRFAGIPLGHEFTSLILALLQTGGHPPKVSDDTIAQIKALKGDFHFETYMSLSCQNCPEVVQALNLMAILNPNISHTAIDGALFPEEVEKRDIMAVPSVYMNGELFDQGRMTLDQIISKLDDNSATKTAAELSNKPVYDVLVIGGGPAGVASAIYAARKGIRTGIVADRFGGQVQDTAAIENFISVQQTQGPALASNLQQHLTDYDIDVINNQQAASLAPASAGEPHQITLASGAILRAKSLILATGASWRQVNVPGENEYRNRGVAYCPHCDGPLFKGKSVAVIGGGNSGVEAAIDLAGLAKDVTLLEFDSKLRADAVLQKKLESLDNTRVIVNAQTTSITGDGSRANGLEYLDREHNNAHKLPINGVFVQIGLVPNTHWLGDTITLSPHGEILIDAKGATSQPGIFAAGDATTVPYKQIVVAVGEGAKAALSAFDYLIRQDVKTTEAA